MLPQEDMGRATPYPRKLKADSSRIAPAMLKEAATIIWADIFGIMCLMMMVVWPTPRVLAAATKSLSFRVSVWALTILATPVQETGPA